MFRQPLILVVEDNDDHVFLLRHALTKAGIDNPVQVVSTGEDVIAYLAGTESYSNWEAFPLPAVVLLDLKLPGIDGLAVLKWIRQQPGLKALMVAILTSSDNRREVNLAYELGANSYLIKPVDMDRLAEMMRAFRNYCLSASEVADVFRTGTITEA
jgi:CheY-like chemotaxis protein